MTQWLSPLIINWNLATSHKSSGKPNLGGVLLLFCCSKSRKLGKMLQMTLFQIQGNRKLQISWRVMMILVLTQKKARHDPWIGLFSQDFLFIILIILLRKFNNYYCYWWFPVSDEIVFPVFEGSVLYDTKHTTWVFHSDTGSLTISRYETDYCYRVNKQIQTKYVTGSKKIFEKWNECAEMK